MILNVVTWRIQAGASHHVDWLLLDFYPNVAGIQPILYEIETQLVRRHPGLWQRHAEDTSRRLHLQTLVRRLVHHDWSLVALSGLPYSDP